MSAAELHMPDAPGAIGEIESETHTREETFRGMRCVDTSSSERIPVIMSMVGALSRAHEPREVLRAFSDGLRQLNGPRGYISLSTRGLQPGEYKITRMLMKPGDHIEDADPWRDWNNIPVQRGGFFGEIIRNAYPELIHHAFLRGDPAVGDALARFGSMMVIPLFEDGEPLNWSILLREEAEGFSVTELEESILRTNLGGATVRNVMMTRQLQEANKRIRREMEQIAKIQRALLPQSLPKIPGLSIATSYETFDTAGGDLYDLALVGDESLPAEERPLGMLIADASGHGPAAAVITAMLNAIFATYDITRGGPSGALEYANRHLMRKRLEGNFATAFLAVYEPKSRRLTYARAGHNPPLLKVVGSGGAVTRLEQVGGIPLAVMPDVDYEPATITLHSGQTLVLYTDGIVEAMNAQRQMFGVEGIERALTACSGEPQCVITSITTALRAHEGGVRPADDQTIVAIKVD